MAQATIDTTVAGIQGVPISPAAPANGQALVFNGTVWIPTTPAYLPLSGGTLTGQLIINEPGANWQLAVIGNASIAGGNNVSWNAQPNAAGTGWEYMLGNNAAATAAMIGTGLTFSLAPPGAAGNTINFNQVMVLSNGGMSINNPISVFNNVGAVAALNLTANIPTTDCQIALTGAGPSNVWLLGVAASNSNFYVFNQTVGFFGLQIDPQNNVYISGSNYITGNIAASGSGTFIWCIPSGGNNSGYCGAPTNAWADMNAFAFTQQSAPETKINVAKSPAGALNRVNALEVITYQNVPPPVIKASSFGNPDYSRVRTGFDASEVYKVHPDAVSLDNGSPVGYSLSDMVALLWQAVQELSAQVQGAK